MKYQYKMIFGMRCIKGALTVKAYQVCSLFRAAGGLLFRMLVVSAAFGLPPRHVLLGHTRCGVLGCGLWMSWAAGRLLSCAGHLMAWTVTLSSIGKALACLEMMLYWLALTTDFAQALPTSIVCLVVCPHHMV